MADMIAALADAFATVDELIAAGVEVLTVNVSSDAAAVLVAWDDWSAVRALLVGDEAVSTRRTCDKYDHHHHRISTVRGVVINSVERREIDDEI